MVPARQDICMNAEHPYDPPPLWVQGQALPPSVPRLGARLVGGNQLASPFMGAGPRPAPSVPRLGTRLVEEIQLASSFMGAGPRPAPQRAPPRRARFVSGNQLASPFMGAGPRPV